MKNECSIVRDLLPLYLEQLLSDETREFVQEHLSACPACAAELTAMQGEGERLTVDEPKTDAGALVTIKKKLRRKSVIAVAVTAGVLILVILLLNTFPIYRFTKLERWAADYYTQSELALLLYAGSPADHAEAQAVLRLADAALSDFTHTREENKARYGLLSRYAIAADSHPDTVSVDYSLELWSAHLGGTRGHLWVYYSRAGLDAEGKTTTGSWRIPSLWTVERNEHGVWVVTDIKEHP